MEGGGKGRGLEAAPTDLLQVMPWDRMGEIEPSRRFQCSVRAVYGIDLAET